jgi:hypothetical protein
MPTRTLVLSGTEVQSEGYPPRSPKRTGTFGDRIGFTDDLTSFEFKPSSGPSVSGPTSGGQHSGFCFKVRAKDAAGQEKNLLVVSSRIHAAGFRQYALSNRRSV